MRFAREDGRLEFNNGLIVRPQFVKLQPRDDGLVHTITTIEINHHSLCPRGTFEYQHSVGPSVEDSLRKGFAKWADTDLPVFMDALQEKAEHCTGMVKNIPASAVARPRSRVPQATGGDPAPSGAQSCSQPLRRLHMRVDRGNFGSQSGSQSREITVPIS